MRSPAEAGQAVDTAGVPVDAATLFPDGDGFLARRARARRAKLLAGVADVLRRALEPARWCGTSRAGCGIRCGSTQFPLEGLDEESVGRLEALTAR